MQFILSLLMGNHKKDKEARVAPPLPPPPVSITFEKSKRQLKKDLNLPKEVLIRTRELIDDYQPRLDKEVKDRIEHYKYLIEKGKLHITPNLDIVLPKHLRSDFIIGACLYLACKEKGISMSQFQIAKAQGHWNTSALSKTVRQILTNLGKNKN